MNKAIELPITDCGISVAVGEDGVWMHFSTAAGLFESIHVLNCLDSKYMRQWCRERKEQAAIIHISQDESHDPDITG